MGDRVGEVQSELSISNGDKGQALTDFIAEFNYSDTTEVVGTVDYVEIAKEVETERGETSATKYEDSD